MSLEQGIFDPTQHQPSTGVVPGLPPSDSNGHVVQIVDAEMKLTNAGDGSYLQLQMEILEGPHKGMKGVDRLNLGNTNPQTVDIAARQLSAYCAVTGVQQQFNYQNNCSVMYGKPFRAIVVQQANNTGYTNVQEVRFLDGRKANQGGQAGGGFPPQPANLGVQPGQQQQPPFQQPQPQQQFQQPQQQFQQPQQQTPPLMTPPQQQQPQQGFQQPGMPQQQQGQQQPPQQQTPVAPWNQPTPNG